MYFSYLLVSSLFIAVFASARPQEVVKSVSATITRENTESKKWGSIRMCLDKKQNPGYYTDTCLKGTPVSGVNVLGALAGISTAKVPANSVWSAYKVTAAPLGDYERPGSQEHSFMIVNEGITRSTKPQCLTWEKVPPYEQLEAVVKLLGKALPTKSYWLGGVTLQDCAFPGDWKTSTTTVQLTETAYRQLFWSKTEGTGGNLKQRIIPRVFAGGLWPSEICNGSLGIFDRMESGKEPGYIKSLVAAIVGKTTIGWGCTSQKWTLAAN
ncbi:hypothetical protein TWF481_006155 [Arthrobotrys musiformis]|uniref:Uncharacterized protein n=1 Tax=Arthrobotrys musiformis TaxID=47236 RepID=A0AAV9WLK8_9PEZI